MSAPTPSPSSAQLQSHQSHPLPPPPPPPFPTSITTLTDLPSADVDALYRPFLTMKNEPGEEDWVAALDLEAGGARRMAEGFLNGRRKVRVLVLYGSLRERSFSRLTAYESARLLTTHFSPYIDVRIYNPQGLPMKDGVSEKHEKVQELRALSEWSDAQVWVCPEQHGTITGVLKNQIDWIPLSVGSVRPTQGKTLALVQVNGGSQSFNTVSVLRNLGRWMRMFTIPNQSSIPKVWTQYTPSDRLMPSSNRDRLVDVMEELVKFTCILAPHAEVLADRYSEREERREHGRLRTQGEVEAARKGSGEEVKRVEEAAKRGSEVA